MRNPATSLPGGFRAIGFPDGELADTEGLMTAGGAAICFLCNKFDRFRRAQEATPCYQKLSSAVWRQGS